MVAQKDGSDRADSASRYTFQSGFTVWTKMEQHVLNNALPDADRIPRKARLSLHKGKRSRHFHSQPGKVRPRRLTTLTAGKVLTRIRCVF